MKRSKDPELIRKQKEQIENIRRYAIANYWIYGKNWNTYQKRENFLKFVNGLGTVLGVSLGGYGFFKAGVGKLSLIVLGAVVALIGALNWINKMSDEVKRSASSYYNWYTLAESARNLVDLIDPDNPLTFPQNVAIHSLLEQHSALRKKMGEEPLRSEKLQMKADEYADRQIKGLAPKTLWTKWKETLSSK